MTWREFAIRPPPALAQLGASLTTGLDTIRAALDVLRASSRVEALLTPDGTEVPTRALNAAIRSVVLALTGAMDTMLDSAGVYGLVVPLPKRGVGGFLPDPVVAEDSPVNFPLHAALARMDEPARARLQQASMFEHLLDPTRAFYGGNAHFARAVLGSIYDTGDINRPTFTEDTHWVYAVFVAGSEDPTTALTVAGALDRLLGSRTRVAATRSTADLVPQRVRVTASGRGEHAVIEWEPLAGSRIVPSLDNLRIVPVRYAIIRTPDERARTARHVTDLFATPVLTRGMTGLYGAKVLWTAPYDGVVSRWVDPEPLEEGKTYVYHVAFQARLEQDPETPPIEMTFGPMSGAGAITVDPATPVPSGLSRAPDWFRTPSAAQLIPGLATVVDLVQEYLRTLAQTATSNSDRVDAYLNFLDRQIAEFAGRAEQMRQHLAQLTGGLTMSDELAGVHVLTGKGQGSAVEFARTLLEQLSADDPNRPPFDDGTEYVTGAVVLAVGPDLSSVESAFRMFELLFGASEEDPVLEGINAIADTVATVEQRLIDSVLGPAPAAPPTPSFDRAMTPGGRDPDCT